MKRVFSIAALALLGSAGAAYAAAPDTVTGALASCCAALAACCANLPCC